MKEKLIKLLIDWGTQNNDSLDSESVADYLLANGVIVPPCKIGDTVYELQNKRIQAYTIETVTYNGRYFNFSWVLKDNKGIYGNVCGFDSYRIGKIVFLTKEEAEKALERMENHE